MNFEHNKHDRLLVARFAAGDAYPSEKPLAERQVAACSECAALAADIRLLTRHTAQMPAPRRPRDFRITADQAERLRGSWLERAMRRFASPGWGVMQPVAGAAMALGLALAVVGTLPTMGGLASAPADQGGNLAPIGLDSSAPPEIAAPASGPGSEMFPDGPKQPDSSSDGRSGGMQTAEGSPEPMTAEVDDVYLQESGSGVAGQSPSTPAGPNPLVLGGLLVAMAALAVLLVTIVARRRFADPLLR